MRNSKAEGGEILHPTQKQKTKQNTLSMPSPTQHTNPNPQLCCEVMEDRKGKRTWKEEDSKRGKERGRRKWEAKTTRVSPGHRGSLTLLHLSWGTDSLSMWNENKIQRHNFAQRGKRERLEMECRNSSCPAQFYSGIHFTSSWMTTLNPWSSHLLLFRSTQREGGEGEPVCWQDPPLLYLQSKRSSPFFKVISEPRWTPSLSLALLLLGSDVGEMFPQNGSEWSGRPDDTLTSGSQHCCPMGLLQSLLGHILWCWPQNQDPGSAQPPQATSGAEEDLWSHFLPTLASFFTSLKISYFHQDQFLFSPAVAVVSPQTELWSTGVAATWTVPAAEHRPSESWERAFLS